MVDRYTKSVLTVIASALILIAVQNLGATATAQLAGCTRTTPCWVVNGFWDNNKREAVPCFNSKYACFTTRPQ